MIMRSSKSDEMTNTPGIKTKKAGLARFSASGLAG